MYIIVELISTFPYENLSIRNIGGMKDAANTGETIPHMIQYMGDYSSCDLISGGLLII